MIGPLWSPGGPPPEVSGLTLEEELAYVRLCGAKGPRNRAFRNLGLTALAAVGALTFGAAVIGALREVSGLNLIAALLAGLATLVLYRGVELKPSPPAQVGELEMAAQLEAAIAHFLDGVRVAQDQIKALRRGSTLLVLTVGAIVLDMLR